MNARTWSKVTTTITTSHFRQQFLRVVSKSKFTSIAKPLIPILHYELPSCARPKPLLRYYSNVPITTTNRNIPKFSPTSQQQKYVVHDNDATQLYKPIAFYSLIPISQERVVILRDMIESRLSELGVVGRIYLAPEEGIGGINSQMAVPLSQMTLLKKFFNDLHDDFGAISFTEGIEELKEPCFRKLRVMIKKNLVGVRKSISASDLIDPSNHHLDPASWHKQLNEKADKAFLVDMRNHYEYDMGHFEHAAKLDVDTFREGLDELQSMIKDQPDKTLYMYCTGGIRCDVTASYLRKKGINDFKMLKGGITAYGNYIKSLCNNGNDDDDENNDTTIRSLFRGKNFSFDDRRGERITDDVLTQCYQCGKSCDVLHNCANTRCHLLFVQCESCRQAMNKTCSDTCHDVLLGKEAWDVDYDYHRQIRPMDASSLSS
ncbi:hypothetical protein INT45_011978 [Circinella minor]|uniref:Rhodanese domain-containing protein n=1 Tax=Circinella minor TaxID=1195481 RepID=A0A8H7SCT5_9FUNG|nr:hypothetical protein INT45_011978 [Circinella minor]